jgi:CheY-like chemotaxis protein
VGSSVSKNRLAGRVILVVEDEPLIALDVVKALRAAGARVLSAGYMESGLCTTEHPDLSAAVIDLHLGDGSGTTVCKRLRERSVPFVIHTGCAGDHQTCASRKDRLRVGRSAALIGGSSGATVAAQRLSGEHFRA